MQVRSIEFQENFGRVPVEASRQQHVLQREPELARAQVAREATEEQTLDLSRPVPTTETEGTIVDPDQERFPERRLGSRRVRRVRRDSDVSQTSGTEVSDPNGVKGTRIDLLA